MLGQEVIYFRYMMWHENENEAENRHFQFTPGFYGP